MRVLKLIDTYTMIEVPESRDGSRISYFYNWAAWIRTNVYMQNSFRGSFVSGKTLYGKFIFKDGHTHDADEDLTRETNAIVRSHRILSRISVVYLVLTHLGHCFYYN